MKDIRDILPIWSVEQDAILSKMADITIGYSVELPEIFTLSEQQMEALHETWVKALRLFPAGVVLHKQDWFTQCKHPVDLSNKDGFLARSSEKHFAERPCLKHSCYLFLTLKPKNRVVPNSAMSTLLRSRLVPVEMMDDLALQSFSGVVEQFVRVISDSGLILFTRMKEKDLIQSINRYLSLDIDGITRDIDLSNGITAGEKHCELFSLGEVDCLPDFCSSSKVHEPYSTDKYKFPVGFVTSIGQLLPCNHIYSQYISIEDEHTTVKKLETKRLRLQSMSAYSRGNTMARDAVNDFLNEAMVAQRQLIRAHFNLLAWADGREGLADVRGLCAAALSKMDVRPRIETVGTPQIHWAGIPGNAADLPINETFLTFSQQACCFLNMETNYRSSVSPFGLRLADRIYGRPVDVDLWDEPMRTGLITNRNMIVVGPSGSGKSFFDNHMMHTDYESGAHIVVVDMGNSYAGLCEMLGGYYYTYTENKPIAFNPFYGGVPDTEKKESIKTLLVALWKKEEESFLRSEYVALSNALQLYFESEADFRCFNTFYDFVRDEFTVLLRIQEVKEKDFDVANFLYVMRPYYRGGEFDFLLNATENLDVLDQRFIVFEIDTIKDHPILFPVVTIIIMELFISKMRRLPGVRKVILIEEAWKAIAKAGMAEYVKYLFKTVRKYYGKAIVVTQDLDDILHSDIIRQTIVNNADIKVLLDQSKYQHRFAQVQELLGLPDAEVPKILSMNKANDPSLRYKEVYIWPLAKVYRVEVSPEEYLCYTTEEREKVRVQEAAKRFGGIEAGIQSLVMVLVFLAVSVSGHAQVPVIGEVIAKVVKVLDLKVQRQQMEQLLLQNAKKLLENKLHELKLKEISEWTFRQKELWQKYYEELVQVNTAIISRKQLGAIKKERL
jgi:conjugation system TraG family ATPase